MNRDDLGGFVCRFTIVHVATYIVFGILFLNLMDYAGRFASPELSPLMRPTDSPWVMAGPLFQFVRGPILALGLYPLRRLITKDRWGWLKLWWVLWALTSIGSVAAGPGSLEGFIYTKLPWQHHLFGYPEITLQMLAFAYLLGRWEGRVQSANDSPLLSS